MPLPPPPALAAARRVVLDTAACPACLWPLLGTRCDACGLDLTGGAGAAVWAASVAVAEALDQRAELVARLSPEAVSAPAALVGTLSTQAAPLSAAPPRSPVPGRAPAWEASTVLQVLGVALLAVACLVLVAYRWHHLDAAARAAAVAVATLAALLGAPALRRRRVPRGAEAVAALGVTLVVLDLWAWRVAGAIPALDGARYAAAAGAVAAAVLGGWAAVTGLRAPAVAAPLLAVGAGAVATGPSPTWAVVAACAVAASAVLAGRTGRPRLATLAPPALAAAAVVGVPTAVWLAGAAARAVEDPGATHFGAEVDGLTTARPEGLLLGAAALVGLGLLARVHGTPAVSLVARRASRAVELVALLVVVPALGDATGADQPTATVLPLVLVAAAAVVLDPMLPRGLHPVARTGAFAALLAALVAARGSAAWTACALAALASLAFTAAGWFAPPLRPVTRVVGSLLGWGALVALCGAAGGSDWLVAARIGVVASAGAALALLGAAATRAHGHQDEADELLDDPHAGHERLAHGVALVSAATVDLLAQPWDVPADAVLAGLGAVLTAAGAVRLRAHPGAASWTALGPGTALVLGPVVLAGFVEPGAWRLLLALAVGAVAVLVGARLRLQAPFVLGSTALGLVAVRQLAPFAVAVGWWPVVALGGAVLLTAGVTYERRLRDARAAASFLAAMR
ncbi:DUF2157 domain-containing protein [Cellulomonas alba]|uniref:DUF2157 domain-containing protein n=1 Tax=Cellulomonas alba TaxID=3053467 RepID=A0ABT7SJL5_9CELL|nr:hypothetical protein [Cellulomonas alba]MDM7856378.1 hypothetical protein [Cellulomonas alba]